MAQADLSGISFFLPILSFLVVFIIMFVLFVKTKLVGENKWAQAFVSFVFATIFVSAIGPREYILNITVWFSVLLVSLFFIMLIVGALGGKVDFMHKGIGVAFVILTIIMFIVSAIFVFSEYFAPYLPWSSGAGADSDVLYVTSWIFSPRVVGAALLLIVSGIASWILFKTK